MDEEGAMASFMSVTGATDTEARFHLEASGWSLDGALGQFFDGGRPAPPGGMAPLDEEEEIRAPDRAKQLRLLDPMSGGGGGGGPAAPAMAGAFADFRDDDDDDDDDGAAFQYDDDDDDDDQMKKSGSKPMGGLAKLFAPPTDLMHTGDFLSARRKGKDERKWLLVVIVEETSFETAEMNRDVWADETVAAVVESQYILWMRPHIDPQALVYVDRYDRDRAIPGTPTARVHPKHPHIAVVDPRTGRRLWFKEGKQVPDTLLEHLTDIADRHNMDDEPRKPSEVSDPRPVPPPVHAVAPPPPPPPINDVPPPWDSFPPPSAVADPTTAVLVQIKLCNVDGSPRENLKRQLNPDDLVGSIFKLAQIETNAGFKLFDLRFGFPPNQLWPLAHKTVKSLHGQSIQMKFL